MTDIAVSVESLSKRYALGQIGASTFRRELQRAWHKLHGRSPEEWEGQVGMASAQPGRDDSLWPQSRSDEIWALRDITFEVPRGQVMGIIGRNGAGKSTLLKILTRITEPTSGRAVLRGHVASLLEVGTGFHPELTGRENIFLSGAVLGMKSIEVRQKLDRIIEFAGVGPFIDTPVKRYSSGMYVRLAFAVAAHLETEIMLVDEVLAVGDIEFQERCLGKMGDVSRSGRTILFVSHNMAAVESLCPRAILLEGGSIAAEGASKDVIERYVAGVRKSIAQPLHLRTDREGEGRVRFVGTWIENERGDKVDVVRSGETIRIVGVYETRSGYAPRTLDVAFALNTSRGMEIADLTTRNTRATISGPVPRRGRVECFIPRLPFNRGVYHYNMLAREGAVVEDWVQKAGEMRVESGDYFKTGAVAESDRIIFVDQVWSVRDTGR